MRKRVVSLVLCICIIVGVLSVTMGNAQETEAPDVAILESILNGDRRFVIDTLIGESGRPNLSTNPYAQANYVNKDSAMMYNVLDAYQDKSNPHYSGAYKAAVDIMEKVYNASDYTQGVADYVAEFAVDLFSIFGINAESFIDDLSYSVNELRYESILKEVLVSEYTSSDGRELTSSEIDLIYFEQLDRFQGELKTFTDHYMSYVKANYEGEEYASRLDYYKDYLVPYGENMRKVLESFSKAQSEPMKENELELLTMLATLAQYERFESSQGGSSDIPVIGPTYFLTDDVYEIIKGENAAISTISKTIATYAFIQSIAFQSNEIKHALNRMANGSDIEMNNVFSTFANEIGQMENTKLIGYETLMRYLRNTGTVVSLEQAAGKKLSEKLRGLFSQNKEGIKEFTTLGALSNISEIAEITAWCADKATNFESTCKKTYELKYLDKMIRQAIQTYERDVADYQSDISAENAKKVLEDLLLIQKMRLRGETIAYRMMQGQFDSPLGLLISTGTINHDQYLQSTLDQKYQRMVDVFIGASVMPSIGSGITVKDGEIMTIRNDVDRGGLHAELAKPDGTWYGIGELQTRLCGGIEISVGGKLLAGTGTADFYTPYIANKGGEVYIVDGMRCSELTNNGGNTYFGNSEFIIEEISLSGGTVQSPTGGTLLCDKLSLDGYASADMDLTCTKSLSIGGKLSGGQVYAKGTIIGYGGTVDLLTICGKNQTLTGSFTANDLVYSHDGELTQEGVVYVANSVKNVDCRVRNGENTILTSTGSIVGKQYHSAITLDGAQLRHRVHFDDSLYTRGTASLAGADIGKMLVQLGGTLIINDDVSVVGDVSFAGTVEQTDGSFIVSGDVTGNGTSISLGRLELCGSVPQSVSINLSAKDFINRNPHGLQINSSVTASGLARSSSSIDGNGVLILTDSAFFDEETFCGNVTLNGLTGSIPKTVKGTVTINGDIRQAAGTSVTELLIDSGNLFFDHCTATISGPCRLQGGAIRLLESDVIFTNLISTSSETIVEIDKDSTLTVPDFSVYGTVSGDGACRIGGDLYNEGSFKIHSLEFSSRLPQSVNGDAIYVDILLIPGRKTVNLCTTIYVSESWQATATVNNLGYIVVSNGTSNYRDQVYDLLLTVEGDLIIDGYTLTARNGLSVHGGVVVKNGGALDVHGFACITGDCNNTFIVDENSSMWLWNLAEISTFSQVQIDGEVSFCSDTVLNSVTLSGGGTVSLAGDLIGTGYVVEDLQTFYCSGKLPQKLSGGTLHFVDLRIDNPSAGGVHFASAAQYFGEYDAGDCAVTGTITYIGE